MEDRFAFAKAEWDVLAAVRPALPAVVRAATSETKRPDLERFAIVRTAWQALVGRIVLPTEEAFAAVAADADALRAAGKWVSGPSDLLTLLGRHRDELFHSRLIGWLMRPSGQHQLGDRFLRAFFAEVLPGVAPVTRTVDVALEETREGVSAVTGEPVAARADLVLYLDGTMVVVENKVDAGEQANQCERLYWPWAADGVDTYWVFLSPSGRAPITANSDQAREAWRSMSYHQVRRALERALADADPRDDTGRGSARQYLATLMARGY
jgi:hypothetical protein